MNAHAACLWLSLEDEQHERGPIPAYRWSHTAALAQTLASEAIAWGHCQSHCPF